MKPLGSAYVSIQMSIDCLRMKVDAKICIDTGADITLCDSLYLTNHFGANAINHITPMIRPPRLRSATGHNLKVLGQAKITLFLGEYKMTMCIVIYEGKSNIFLLGSDAFYNRLIYDRGRYLAFADSKYPPIPIQYELSKGAVKTLSQYQVAPRSHALVQVKVVQSAQFTGQEVILTPLTEHDTNCKHLTYVGNTPCTCGVNILVVNTVAVIDPQGCAFVVIENNSDDILTILEDTEIADANLISSDENPNCDIYQIEQLVDDPTPNESSQSWPLSTLKGELADKIPNNVIVQWDKIKSTDRKLEIEPFENDDKTSSHDVNYVHDKEERKNLLDGCGEGFPAPPSGTSVHPDQVTEVDPLDPEAWLSNVERSHLSDQEWLKLKEILVTNRDAFSKSKTEIGCCNYFKVELPLKPGTGYLYNKPRPLPFKHREIAAETISELLAKGVIRPSKSPHATNIVCVKKKTINGVISYRVCCDLRQVNEHSVPNRFPNYWIEDAMSKIQGAAFRSALDFKDAFHMLVLDEKSIPVTAFYFNNVLYEYVRVPFGHVNAMNAFCCLMALLCVGYEASSYYADDLMLTTKTDHTLSRDQLFDQHLGHIDGMLKRIIDAGLKLVAHKCQWCYDANKPMEWLGFTMENNLLKPQESKVKAIKEFPTPTSAKQVISFVSTASFYRRFIKGFAKIAQPMYAVANTEPFVWTKSAQDSFERLKEVMCSDTVLRLPRQGEPFQIYSDASAGAIGVVLCQIDPVDKKSHPCAFGSRKFNDCEMKLSIPCKELLAIVYGLNLWSYYICGNPIQVFSDCRAWTFLKVQSGNSGKISRLALLISEYDISISYVKGTANKAADGLSRAYDDGLTKFDDQITARHPALEKLEAPELPEGEVMKLTDYLDKCEDFLSTHWPKILKEHEELNPVKGDDVRHASKVKSGPRGPKDLTSVPNNIKAEADYVDKTIQESAILHIDRSHMTDFEYQLKKRKFPFQVDESLTDETSIIDDSESISSDFSVRLEDEINQTTDSSFKAACYNIRLVAINESCFSLDAFSDMQRQDEFCSNKLELVKKKDNNVIKSGYFVKRNILMRKMETRDGQVFNVVCIPKILIKPLLESSHKSLLSGHFGSKRYFLNMSRKYYWPKMRDDITNFHHSCLPCIYNDKFPVKYISGHVIRPLYPMHVVHCDLIVGLPRALDGSHAILLLYDGFSRLTFGIPLTSEKADYVVKKLMSHFVSAFGLPWALHSDNGRNIDGSLIRHLALMLGVIKTSTPPHTPNANPTETMCGAVSMLIRKALNESDKRYWSLCLPFILNALNSTVHTATGYSPNSLFFGRFQERELVPLIPMDSESANVNEYYQKMRRFQELAFQIVRHRNERKLEAKKEDWDKHARTHSYKPGDFVLIKNNNPASGPGRKKLRAIYVGPFRVLKSYMSSLIVIPWTENSRLEEYNKDPNLFRLMHRGDIKPFHTRQVSVKHCKPFHGKLETEDIIDPIMLTRFLDTLGIDNSDEILSEIDRSSNSDSSYSSRPSDDSHPPVRGKKRVDRNLRTPPAPSRRDPSDSSSGFSDPPNNPLPIPAVVIPNAGVPALPLAPALPVNNPEPNRNQAELIHRHAGDPAVANLLDNLDMPEADKQLLRQYYQAQSNMSTISARTRINRRRIDELEQLVRSTDPVVRQRAEFELNLALDQLRADKQEFEDSRLVLSFKDDDISSSSSIHSGSDQSALNPEELPSFDVQSNEDELLPQNISIGSDHGQPSPVQQPNPNINIRTPNMSITISHSTPITQSQDDPFIRRPRVARTPTSTSRDTRIRDWVSGVSPHFGATHDPWGTTGEAEAGTPVTTRRGRVVKPVVPFDPSAESLRQKQSRDLERAIKESKEAVKRQSETLDNRGASANKSSKNPDLPVKGDILPRQVDISPSQVTNPFARSSVMARSPTVQPAQRDPSGQPEASTSGQHPAQSGEDRKSTMTRQPSNLSKK